MTNTLNPSKTVLRGSFCAPARTSKHPFSISVLLTLFAGATCDQSTSSRYTGQCCFWRNSLGAPEPNVTVRETVGTNQEGEICAPYLFALLWHVAWAARPPLVRLPLLLRRQKSSSCRTGFSNLSSSPRTSRTGWRQSKSHSPARRK